MASLPTTTVVSRPHELTREEKVRLLLALIPGLEPRARQAGLV